MPVPPDPNRLEIAKPCKQVTPLPLLIWSSHGASVCRPTLQEPGLSQLQWLELAWNKALQTLACQDGEGTVWVLEPDPLLGPTHEALSNALAGLHCQPLVLVLLPQALKDPVPWLDAGADRCMPANRTVSELAAMLRTMLRRTHGMTASISAFGPLHFDHQTQTLFNGDQCIWLTCRETQVCALLFRSGTHFVASQEVLQALAAGAAQPPKKALVALYVHRVNRKMRAHGVHIDLMRGHGYRLALRPADFAPTARPLTNNAVLSQWLRTPPQPTPGETGPCT